MNIEILAGLLAISLKTATPLILAGLGEIVIEKSGTLNLSIEGTMFLGAFVGFFAGFSTGSPWLGMLAASLVGALLGSVMGLLTVALDIDQHIAGFALTALAIEMGLFVYHVGYVTSGTTPHMSPFKAIRDPFLSQIPVIGQIFKQQGLTYFSLLCVPMAHMLLFNTPFGKRLRATGESAAVADSVGISVVLTRFESLVLGSILIGLGGGFLSVAQTGFVTPGIIGGRGWIAIALVLFGNWNPFRVTLGALLFGGIGALQFYLQTVGWGIQHEYLLMLPYLVTLTVLALTPGKAVYPGDFLRHYQRQ